MKKVKQIPSLLAILMLLLLGSLFFQGCGDHLPEIIDPEEEVIEPEPETPTYNFKVIINDKEGGSVEPVSVKDLPEGNSVTVTIKPDSAYTIYSIKVNDLPLPNFEPTTQEFSFVVDNIKRDQKVEIEFIEADVLMISVKSIEYPAWYLRALKRFKEDGTYLFQVILPDEMLNESLYFLFPSMKSGGSSAEGKWGSWIGWSLKDRVLRFDNNDYYYYELLELTPVKCVVRLMPLEYDRSKGYYYYDEYTFERVPF